MGSLTKFGTSFLRDPWNEVHVSDVKIESTYMYIDLRQRGDVIGTVLNIVSLCRAIGY